MAQGIHIYGSASIDALRAAELHSFGMGRIFESKERSGSEICALRPASHQRCRSIVSRLGSETPADQRRVVASEMIKAIRAHLAAGVAPLTVSYRFYNTSYHKAAARH